MNNVLKKEVTRVMNEILSGKVDSYFIVTLRDDPNHSSDHISMSGQGKFQELLGNVEKCKFEVIQKVVNLEN
jgi:hypothetical protein